MQKTNKSKLALKQKATKGDKGVKKVAEKSPKQKKQEVQKLKKAAGGAIEAKTGVGKKQNSKKKAQKVVEVEEPESEEEDIEAAESDDEQMESEPEDAENDKENAQSEEEDDDDSDQEQEQEDSDQEQEQEDAESDQGKVELQSAQSEEDPEKRKLAAGNTIFLSNVPIFTHRVDIVKAFAPFGKVLAVIFSGKGYFFTNVVVANKIRALVVLDSPEAADKALAKKSIVLSNHKIFLKKHEETHTSQRIVSDQSNTVFVSDMNNSTTKIGLKKLFADCGEIVFINFLKGYVGRAYVCFKKPESVALALDLNGSSVDGASVKISPYSYTPKVGKVIKFKPKNKGNFLKNKSFEHTPKKGGKFQKKEGAELKGVKSKVIKKTPKKKIVVKE